MDRQLRKLQRDPWADKGRILHLQDRRKTFVPKKLEPCITIAKSPVPNSTVYYLRTNAAGLSGPIFNIRFTYDEGRGPVVFNYSVAIMAPDYSPFFYPGYL